MTKVKSCTKITFPFASLLVASFSVAAILADTLHKGNLGSSWMTEETKILNGGALGESYPFYVAIMKISKSKSRPRATDYDLQCGGSLISNRHVLSSGHCTVNLDPDYNFEAWLAPLTTTVFPLQRARVAFGNTSKAYNNPNDFDNDIGIYTLSTLLVMDPLSSLCIQENKKLDNIAVRLIGFGNTECRGRVSTTLRYADGVTSNSTNCNKIDPNNFLTNSNQLCARLRRRTNPFYAEQGVGDSDSGGPLFYERKSGSYVQVGLVSFNVIANGTIIDADGNVQDPCPNTKYPGVYTIPGAYKSFIKSIIPKFENYC